MVVNIVVNGSPRDLHLPILDMGRYVVRPMQSHDFEDIAHHQDPSLTEPNLSAQRLVELTQIGFSFVDREDGIVGYVAREKETNRLIGRAYLRTSHLDASQEPCYYLNLDGGLEVEGLDSIIGNSRKIVQLGGLLVNPDYRQQGVASALVYARLKALETLEEFNKPDAMVHTYLGVFRQSDNPLAIDFLSRIYANMGLTGIVDKRSLASLIGKGELVSKRDLSHIFRELKDYEVGQPRLESAGSFVTFNRLITGEALVIINGTPYSPDQRFKMTNTLHHEYGGFYAVRHNY